MNKNKKRIVFTGGSGLLSLNWACAIRECWNVVLATHNTLVHLKGTTSLPMDLDRVEPLIRQIERLEPDLLVHSAGLTNVDHCEENPDQARHVNAVIARNVAQAAVSLKCPLIHISTDHLFAGDGSLCRETDPLQPINQYASTKALGETWVRETNPEALILRTNFFGWGHARRQSFSDWLIFSLRAGKALTLFDDVFFSPILVDALAHAAHDLVEKGARGIFHLGGGERLSKFEFALKLADEFGLSADLIQRGQLQVGSLLAPRPKDMSLDNHKACQVLGREPGTMSQFLSALHNQEKEGRRLELLESIV